MEDVPTANALGWNDAVTSSPFRKIDLDEDEEQVNVIDVSTTVSLDDHVASSPASVLSVIDVMTVW